MRLTAEEYRRGVVAWNPNSVVQVQTLTTITREADGEWSSPLTEASGSKVSSPPGRHVQLRFGPASGSASPYPICWNRTAPEGAVQTLIVDPEPHRGQMIQLTHVPSYGIFHRMVVAVTETITWEDDAVVRVGDSIVRLVTGKVIGERAASMDRIESDGDRVSITSDNWAGTVELEGRFVEVVAPGDDPASAELAASAVLGLVTLLFGAGVVGEVVLSEPWRAAPGVPQEGSYRIPVTRELPTTIENKGLNVIDRVLANLFDGNPMTQALRLALHWFERGVRSRTPLDELISFFVGIEAILNAFASVNGPIPEVAERKKAYAPKIRRLLKGEIDEKTLGWFQQSIGRATTNDRFVFYVQRRGLDASWTDRFQALADIRNKALHGQPKSSTADHAATALDLLTELLKLELSIDDNLPWQTGPKVISMILDFKLATYGYHGHETKTGGA